MSVVKLEDIKSKFIEEKLLTEAQWADAAAKTEKDGGFIYSYLIESTSIADEKIMEVTSHVSTFPPIRLWKYNCNKEVIAHIPKELAKEKMIFPVCKVGNLLTVAVLEPWNEVMFQEAEEMANGLIIVPVVSTYGDIREAIDQFYGGDYEQELQDVIKAMEDPNLELLDGDADESGAITDVSILLSLTDQEPVVRLTNSILQEGAIRKASDIFIEPGSKQLGIRFRVDGVLQDGPHPPKAMHQGVISRLKIMSNLDIAEQRLPQDGRVRVRVENRWVEYRLSTIPSYFGEKACLRILDPGQVRLNLDLLGIEASNLQKIKKCAELPYGMILICGPTGSGKTTTLYSVLNHVNNIEKNLVTVEDPVEFHMDGINQVNVKADLGLDFQSALKSILRQDPDVIMIGEIRDRQTLDIGVKAALTGHLVLSTLHTNSAAGSITRMINMNVEPFLINSSVNLVGSQRLLRVLCSKCKEKFQATEQHLKLLRKKPKDIVEIFKPKGCDACGPSGYKGRASILEILLVTPAMKNLILKKASEADIKALARSEGMMTLRENAIQAVLEGKTSVDEALRVAMKDEEDCNA